MLHWMTPVTVLRTFQGKSNMRYVMWCTVLAAALTLTGCATTEPAAVTGWRVEFGPPGNEVYEAPLDSAVDAPEPPEAVLHWAKTLTPHAPIVSATYRYYAPPVFRVVAENDRDQYFYEVLLDGTLRRMRYKEKRDHIREYASEIVPEGRKYPVDPSAVPSAMLAALKKAMPDVELGPAWFADTLVGPRYIVQAGRMAFYGTPGGVLRCGAWVDQEGLAEVSATRSMGPSPTAEADALLAKYGDRFDFERLIKRLGKGPRDGRFRYVVMGDCRDNPTLRDATIAHFESLNPKPAFVIVSGDVVRHGYADEYDTYLLPAWGQTDIPFFVAVGNHDMGLGARAHEFRYVFGKNSLNYYFDYGNLRFIFLDNCSLSTNWDSALQQADQWLTETPKGYRTYVSAHRPPTTIEKWAYHGMDDDSSKKFSTLMAKHKVDEVYLGHIHAYSTATLDGVDYTLSGGAGAGLHTRFGPQGNVHHYLICDASPQGVTQQVVRFYEETK
jgi:calcineurin-like phosphoesterase family protein